MTPLLLAVLVASLLGSLHCAGMCGPFVAFATLRVKGTTARPKAALLLQIAYHGGRLTSYTALGIAAGQLGATLDLGGSMLGLGRTAGVVAGMTLVAFGAGRILRILGVRLPAFAVTTRFVSMIAAAQAAAARMTPPKRALVIGLLTTALPCGWLYAFVAVAAGTGRPLQGALVMLTFWAGSVPVLAGIGAGLGAFLYRASKPIQVATAIIVVGLGLQSIAGRWHFSASQISAPTSSLDAAVERVSSLLGKGATPCHCH